MIILDLLVAWLTWITCSFPEDILVLQEHYRLFSFHHSAFAKAMGPYCFMLAFFKVVLCFSSQSQKTKLIAHRLPVVMVQYGST